jgi:hypothetical protein
MLQEDFLIIYFILFLFFAVVSADTKWQLGKNNVRERLARLRATGDFSDCVLDVGSGENVEVCNLSLSMIMYYHMLYIYLLATLTEVFLCFFFICKANARLKLAKTGHGLHSSKLVVICVVLLLFVLLYVLFVCKCVLCYCHWMSTKWQLTNISFY